MNHLILTISRQFGSGGRPITAFTPTRSGGRPKTLTSPSTPAPSAWTNARQSSPSSMRPNAPTTIPQHRLSLGQRVEDRNSF